MNIFFKFIFVSLDRGDSKCRKAVASSGAIWAENNFKNSLSFAGKNKVRRKVASGTGCAHEGSGEPVLLQGCSPQGAHLGPGTLLWFPLRKSLLPCLSSHRAELQISISQCSWARMPTLVFIPPFHQPGSATHLFIFEVGGDSSSVT